jgi:hypothetical protein
LVHCFSLKRNLLWTFSFRDKQGWESQQARAATLRKKSDWLEADAYYFWPCDLHTSGYRVPQQADEERHRKERRGIPGQAGVGWEPALLAEFFFLIASEVKRQSVSSKSP